MGDESQDCRLRLTTYPRDVRSCIRLFKKDEVGPPVLSLEGGAVFHSCAM